MERRPALRALGIFWGVVLVVLVGGALGLQVLGPPSATVGGVGASAPHAPATPAPKHGAEAEKPAHAAEPSGAKSTSPPATPTENGAIHAPEAALLEPIAGSPGVMLPRIAADGRTPMQVYARPFDAADKRPRIGLLFVGFGLAEGDSRDAVATLPGAITLGFSPYAVHSDSLLAAARARGHEYLLSIPMESQGYPLNDAGNRSLLTGADPADNARNLNWALGRIDGYAGATGALDGLRGERFAASPGAAIMQAELQARGLYYVDPRPNASPQAGARVVDVVVDEPAVGADIDAKLARLEVLARERGSALGLAGPLRPVTINRVAAWARGLDSRGLALAPVSALPKLKDGS